MERVKKHTLLKHIVSVANILANFDIKESSGGEMITWYNIWKRSLLDKDIWRQFNFCVTADD
jgi:hypothetical protein